MSANPAKDNSPLQFPPVIELPPQLDDANRTMQWILSGLSRLRRTELFGNAFLGLFRTMQRCGFNVLPNHFYWPVPDFRTLEKLEWKPRTPTFDLHLENQVQFASQVVPKYSDELRAAAQPSRDDKTYHWNNGMFESVDAEVAYSLVRHLKPARVVEIGGGFSTRILAQAVYMNQLEDGRSGRLITIEPYPDKVIRDGLPGLTQLIPCRVQDMPANFFDSLDAGDMLFIDSSHVVVVGSDVVYEFIQILPRLRSGVVVHLHDIFYPFDYPRDAVLQFLWFWSEQYLLEVLLNSKADFEVLWSSSAMQFFHPDVLRQAVPTWDNSYSTMPRKIRRFIPTMDHRNIWPSSFWMRRA